MAKATIFPGKAPEPHTVINEGQISEQRVFNNAARPSFVVDFSILKSAATAVQRGRKAVLDKAISDSIEGTETGRRK